MIKCSLLFSVAIEPLYFPATKMFLYMPHTIKDLSNRSFIKNETYTFPLSHAQWQIAIACQYIPNKSIQVFLCKSCMRIKKLTSKRERTEAICRQQQGYWEGRYFVRHTKDITYKKGNRRATWLLNTIYSLKFRMASNTKHPCHLLTKCY